MKTKTAGLTGIPLRYAVAIAEGGKNFRYKRCRTYWIAIDGEDRALSAGETQSFTPDITWAHGGPIIERELYELLRCQQGSTGQSGLPGPVYWEASKGFDDDPDYVIQTGDTPLIAAMRCYVASKLGDEVEVPDELA